MPPGHACSQQRVLLGDTIADLFPGRKGAGAEVQFGHGGLVGGSEPGRDVADRIESLAAGKATHRANLDAAAEEEALFKSPPGPGILAGQDHFPVPGGDF